jgi:hypothetical protein
VHFDRHTVGDGLVLTWRPDRKTPRWRLRYRVAGKSRVMTLGSYADLPLAAAHQSAKELRAKIALGHDPPVWNLSGIRTQTGQPLDMPLPTMAAEWLQKLTELDCNAAYVFPARELQTRMVPHVCEPTMGVAMGKVKAREIAHALTPSARTLAERLERFVSSTTRKLAARLTA